MSGRTKSSGPVVVSVDSSPAALATAVWAVDEALCRDARLRLVHVIAGATVATSAESAAWSVAIIRTNDAARSLTGCIAAVIDGLPGNDATLQRAMREARLRNAPVLAMGVRHRGSNGIHPGQREHGLCTWIQRCPDVGVQLDRRAMASPGC